MKKEKRSQTGVKHSPLRSFFYFVSEDNYFKGSSLILIAIFLSILNYLTNVFILSTAYGYSFGFLLGEFGIVIYLWWIWKGIRLLFHKQLKELYYSRNYYFKIFFSRVNLLNYSLLCSVIILAVIAIQGNILYPQLEQRQDPFNFYFFEWFNSFTNGYYKETNIFVLERAEALAYLPNYLNFGFFINGIFTVLSASYNNYMLYLFLALLTIAVFLYWFRFLIFKKYKDVWLDAKLKNLESKEKRRLKKEQEIIKKRTQILMGETPEDKVLKNPVSRNITDELRTDLTDSEAKRAEEIKIAQQELGTYEGDFTGKFTPKTVPFDIIRNNQTRENSFIKEESLQAYKEQQNQQKVIFSPQNQPKTNLFKDEIVLPKVENNAKISFEEDILSTNKTKELEKTMPQLVKEMLAHDGSVFVDVKNLNSNQQKQPNQQLNRENDMFYAEFKKEIERKIQQREQAKLDNFDNGFNTFEHRKNWHQGDQRVAGDDWISATKEVKLPKEKLETGLLETIPFDNPLE
ncbi:hypothetical protein ACA758_01275 [Mycoplasmopsis agassizii]|uniref:hypothetical protein n=1 Tax=Mycoplasmopsis agassizii TaxID=33922 RepID=UPI0035289344